MAGHIVALGGSPLRPPGRPAPMAEFILDLARAFPPKVQFLATAMGDDASSFLRAYELFPAALCTPSHLPLFGIPPAGWQERVLEQDVIWVGGGNTANLLAVWRAQGFDRLVRQAWENGAVLCGGSAGAICWFEASVTDSYRAELDGMRDGLGLLPGSCCPHYDGEERRRPVYTRLVAEGFPPGYAVDDGAALHFHGTDLVEAVTDREGARAYRLEQRAGEVVEEPLPTRLL